MDIIRYYLLPNYWIQTLYHNHVNMLQSKYNSILQIYKYTHTRTHTRARASASARVCLGMTVCKRTCEYVYV